LEAILIDKVYRNAKTIICQNRESKEYFENKKFKSRLIELPNPVNFADVPTERPEQVADEIVNVGRLIEQKNQRLLIEAFSEISEAYPNYTLKIYGEGPLKETLSNQIREKKLQDRVFLMGTKKRVMYEVNKASIFVLSSDFEGFPNVLIEAMATGMPVISSDFKTGVARELITSDRNGYLFEVGNKDELVKKIKMLINKKSDFLLMGEENRKVAMRYKDNVIAKEWLEELKAD
jgi:glycosyltransferase involved in cell wall biosynthesis